VFGCDEDNTGVWIWLAGQCSYLFGKCHSMCQVFGDLQQWPRQVGAAALEDCIFGGAPQVPIHDFHEENSSQAFIGCT
jgi:hypothetical protein